MTTNTQQSGGYSLTRNTPCTDEARDDKDIKDFRGNVIAFFKIKELDEPRFDWSGLPCPSRPPYNPTRPPPDIPTNTEIRGNILTIIFDKLLDSNSANTRGHLVHVDPFTSVTDFSFTEEITNIKVKGNVLIITLAKPVENIHDVISYFYHSATGTLKYSDGTDVKDIVKYNIKNSGPDSPISVIKSTIPIVPVFTGKIKTITTHINQPVVMLSISNHFSTGNLPTEYRLIHNPPNLHIDNNGYITADAVDFLMSVTGILIEASNSAGVTTTKGFAFKVIP